MTVRRIYWAQDALDALKERGYKVGSLKWKSPREYRSITYNQSGFDVDSNTDRTDHAMLELSKIGKFNLEYHRELPVNTTIRQIVLKQEKSGKWFVSIVTDHDPGYPEPPDPGDIRVEDTVGIDLGILKFTHDSDGVAFTPPDVSDARERIQKRHRDLSRKEHGSANWERARKRLAESYERLRNKFKDFREKLAAAYTRTFNAVFLEDLDVRGLLELPSNGRNIALMSWFETIQTLKRHGRKNGCRVLTIPPEGTTKQCAECGVASRKPLWVRKHSCPSCGFEADRDQNAAWNVQQLGLDELGVEYDEPEAVGLDEAESTPVETALPADSDPALVLSKATSQ